MRDYEPTSSELTVAGQRLVDAAVERAIAEGHGKSLFDSTLLNAIKRMSRDEIIAAVNGQRAQAFIATIGRKEGV